MKNQTIALSTETINRVRVIVAEKIAAGEKTNMKTWIEEAIRQRDISDNDYYGDEPETSRTPARF